MENQIQLTMKLFTSVICFVATCYWVWRLFNSQVIKPNRLKMIMKNQGINGPPAKILLGNILDIKKSTETAATTALQSTGAPADHRSNTLFPVFDQWRKTYGEMFVFYLGSTPVLHVAQPELVKAMTTCTSLDFGKPLYQSKDRSSLLGQGILTSNGSHWAHQRKILTPELTMDRVKGMINIMQESAIQMVDLWREKIDEAQGGIAEIKVDEDMRIFSRDVISKACFGRDYLVGEKIFGKISSLQEAASKNKFLARLPGFRHLPITSNIEEWKSEKEIRSLILSTLKERDETEENNDKDLMQMILEGAKKNDLNHDTLDSFIVDNCKNIYLAGYETSAVTVSWCLMLLASNTDWQERARVEVLEICKGQIPDADMIRKMKLVTMVINETLRLYPPAPIMSREALNDIKLGNIHIPKGMNIWAYVPALHTNTEVWGEDAYEFNPDRFANGVNGACKMPHLYMPFGIGPRVCIGQHLALTEMKMLVALILSSFSFTVSSTYVHFPTMHLVTLPEYGVNLCVKKL